VGCQAYLLRKGFRRLPCARMVRAGRNAVNMSPLPFAFWPELQAPARSEPTRLRSDALLLSGPMLRPLPPGFIAPCLPITAERCKSGPDWVHEIKHDGYRLIARRTDDRVWLYTRRGYIWTDRYPRIVAGVCASKRGKQCTNHPSAEPASRYYSLRISMLLPDDARQMKVCPKLLVPAQRIARWTPQQTIHSHPVLHHRP
jgi:hypothetical protein